MSSLWTEEEKIACSLLSDPIEKMQFLFDLSIRSKYKGIFFLNISIDTQIKYWEGTIICDSLNSCHHESREINYKDTHNMWIAVCKVLAGDEHTVSPALHWIASNTFDETSVRKTVETVDRFTNNYEFNSFALDIIDVKLPKGSFYYNIFDTEELFKWVRLRTNTYYTQKKNTALRTKINDINIKSLATNLLDLFDKKPWDFDKYNKDRKKFGLRRVKLPKGL